MSDQGISRMSSQVMNQNRLFYFDFLRVFTCLSVVMIHVSVDFTIKEVGSIEFWIGNLFDSVSRAGVPIFVMLSGALMLDEHYAFTKEKLINHIKKMLLFFVFWSVFYCFLYQVVFPFIKQTPHDFQNMAWALLKGHFHLWFVPMIIGLYLLVPLLRLWVKSINRRYVEYFFFLAVLFSFIIPHVIQLLVYINPEFETLYSLVDNMHMKYPLGYTSYFVLGWYLHNFELSKRNSSML